jgi:hypothetical protein
MSLDSSVGIVPDYVLDVQRSVPGTGKGFFASLCVWTSSGAHSATHPVGSGCSFPRGKALLGHDTDHLPPLVQGQE